MSLLIVEPLYADELEEDLITSNYYISYDITQDKILFSKNINEKIYPASLTKLMTAILLLDKYKLHDSILVKYPKNYKNVGKVAYIKENEEITIENLIEFLLIYSANDAAYIAALSVSNNVDEFLYLMNEKAKELNMLNTNFVNPDGIDEDDHYTTIIDLLYLTLNAINNKELLTILSKSDFISESTGVEKIYNNTNLLLNEGFVGIKTGWTDKAGLTFIGFNLNNNREIVTIVNKSKVDENKYNHFSDTKILYKLSYDTFKSYNLIDKGENIYTIRNSKKIYNFKSDQLWNEFINIYKDVNLKLDSFDDNLFIIKFDEYYKNYKIKKSDTTIKWNFNPIKIFKIFANNK